MEHLFVIDCKMYVAVLLYKGSNYVLGHLNMALNTGNFT